jgi:hypothetical protein
MQFAWQTPYFVVLNEMTIGRISMHKRLFLLLFIGLSLLWGACNPAYLPVTPTGIVESDEVEGGIYASFGSVGRKVRPVGFRGVVANFGIYFRKGVMEGVDWTLAADTTSLNTAFGMRQDIDGNGVIRPRVGVGWMAGVVGVDYAYRLSEGPDTNYSVGGSALAWIGDAFWTDDPGKAYGLRVGPFGHVGAEPRFTSTVSGGARLDYVPLQFGGTGSPETLVDLFGGTRNPYAEPVDESILSGWPPPRFAFVPGAVVVTIGGGLSFHRSRSSWETGGEPTEEER